METLRQSIVNKLYHTFGIHMFGIPMGNKMPDRPWQKYITERISPEEMHELATGMENIALITGEASGITVIDAEGPDAMKFLFENGLTFENMVPVVRTPFGYHFYFKYSASDKRYVSGNKLDVYTDNMTVLCPTSIVGEHAFPHELFVEFPDSVEELQPIPEKLRKALGFTLPSKTLSLS